MRFVVVVRKITNSPNKYQIKRWKIESTSQRDYESTIFLGDGRVWVQWINAGGTETKNIKNSLLAMPVLRTCR